MAEKDTHRGNTEMKTKEQVLREWVFRGQDNCGQDGSDCDVGKCPFAITRNEDSDFGREFDCEVVTLSNGRNFLKTAKKLLERYEKIKEILK
jgi:hypothetical protein